MKATGLDTEFTIQGRLIQGSKRAAFFTQLEWVKKQCLEKLGFTPFPGTVNVEVLQTDIEKLALIQKEKGIALIPPDPQYCEGKALKASIGGIEGCVFIPPETVNVHQSNIIEFMGPVHVKSTLSIEDGDVVSIMIEKI